MSAVLEHPTKPFDDQKAGTSGLRKRVKVFQKDNYLENYIQSIFNALPKAEYEGKTWLIGGDGRYYNNEAILKICSIALANGVKRLWIAKDGLASTPACSCIIRNRQGGVCSGAIILTASHNPGGPDNDFGVKLNLSRGEPATETLTNRIFEESKKIDKWLSLKTLPSFDIGSIGETKVNDTGATIEVIDAVEDWLALMKEIFDFDMISNLSKRKDFKFVYDGMNGVGGVYARKLFVEVLKCDPSVLLQCTPKPDFGGLHPDPNLTYAKKLVELLKVLDPNSADASTPDFGAAGDGDNDRNMILGKGFFVVPSDSIAVIATFAPQCIPYFKGGLKGVARSMPTSCSLDFVSKKEGLDFYETPTGWKFFGNLMDAGRISLCGEESFGTGSDHIREKDGLWAVLCWLSVVAYHNKDHTKPLVSVREIVESFWKKYGRNFYIRYDYEEVESDQAKKVMEGVLALGKDKTDDSLRSHLAASRPAVKDLLAKYLVKQIDNFEYKDPVDGSVSPNQGIRVHFQDGSRIIYRISGTGSVGATIRVYLDRHESDAERILMPSDSVLGEFRELALALGDIQNITGRKKWDVCT